MKWPIYKTMNEPCVEVIKKIKKKKNSREVGRI